jgi:hypothetical protein
MKLGEADWELKFLQIFSRDSVGLPVEPIYIPSTFNAPIVRIYCFSATARNSWRAAGQLVQIIGDHRNPDFEGQAIDVPLNVMKLVEFSPTVADYSLKFFPKPWIESFELKIESPFSANSP